MRLDAYFVERTGGLRCLFGQGSATRSGDLPV